MTSRDKSMGAGGRASPSLPRIRGPQGSKRPGGVNAKLSSLMMRQGGPVYIPQVSWPTHRDSPPTSPPKTMTANPQDMRTHTHELAALKEWVERSSFRLEIKQVNPPFPGSWLEISRRGAAAQGRGTTYRTSWRTSRRIPPSISTW